VRPSVLALLVTLAVLVAPIVVSYLDHVASYAGICGPHAPDIPARACTRDEYLAEFGAGFGLFGLLVITAMVTPVAVLAGGLTLFLRRRAARRAPGV